MEKLFLKRIKENLEKHIDISENTNILVAFSGGPDSVFLLYFIQQIAMEKGFNLGAAHMNHGLRDKDADKDEEFSENFCRSLGVKFYSIKKNIKEIAKTRKLSTEEAGRMERYSFLDKISSRHQYQWIATAHHMNDSIEQVLMNLIRGTGIEGLCGIKKNRNNIIRPLMDFKKQEILNFLNQKKINFVIDKTNAENIYLRNKVRNQLIPFIEEDYNPSFKNSISNLINICEEENSFMENESKKAFTNICIENNGSFISLDIEKFKALHKSLQRRIIRESVKRLHGTTAKLTLNHIDSAILLADSQSSSEYHLPNNILVTRVYNLLNIKKLKKNMRECSAEEIPHYEKTFQNLESILNFKDDNELLSIYNKKVQSVSDSPFIFEAAIEKINFPLILRSIKPGDRFTPPGFKGRKKVKKILNEKKISGDEKKNILILEYENRILWISGISKNHYDLRPEHGKEALILEFIKK